MPEAVLSPTQWDAIKAASIRGVSDQDLADEFGIEKNAIHQRRFRDEIWRAAIQAKAHAVSECKKTPDSASLAAKVAATVGESIASLGESNRLLALQLAAKGLRAADAAPPEVTSWQDVRALVDIVHKASGMESGNAVQVNVLSSGGYDFVPASVEAMGI
jgi:hypothetical protein